MELKENWENRGGIAYDKKTGAKIGQIDFPSVQIDTLSYMSLTEKVLKLLNGTMEFKADDSIETEYDEPEADNWNDVDEENLEVFPINEYSDKTDLADLTKEIVNKVEASRVVENVDSKAEVEIVDEKISSENKKEIEKSVVKDEDK